MRHCDCYSTCHYNALLTSPQSGGILRAHAERGHEVIVDTKTMNKAFIREPDDDGRAYCPRCGNLGVPVNSGPLDTHIRPESRAKMLDAAWFCNFYRCDVAYFNQFGSVVRMDELKAPVYPHDANAPICACFGLTYDDVEADTNEAVPSRIRAVVAKSNAGEAACHRLAADGQSCLGALQELYLRLKTSASRE